MAHQTEIVVNGQTVEVTEFDHTAQEIDDGIDNLHTLTGGATTPQGALANLGAGVRPNLFINYDFRIWQHYPSGTYTGAPNNIYIADGFIILSSNGDISNTFERVNGGGIKNASGPDCRIKKRLEGADSLNGKVCTMSALKSNGFFTQTVTITGASETADIIEQFTDDPLLWLHPGETMHAIKLEQGDTQTLAYQDDTGAWQLLPQPESDYATQLAKCQRYYWDSGVESYGGCSGIASGKRVLSCNVQFPITMRAVPSIKIYNGNSENEIRNSNTNAKVPLGTTGKYANQSGLSFLYNGSEDVFEDGAVYDFRVIANAEL